MSEGGSGQDKKTEANSDDNEESKPPNCSEVSPKQDIYSRFVSSFENALSTLTSTVSNAVGTGTDGRCLTKSKLKSFSLEGIAEYIKTERPRSIIVMSGAGISTSAGIPDFRSPGSGLYSKLQKYKLPDPQAIFEISFFHKNPEPFFALSKELFPDSLKPTLSHYFVRLLDKKGILQRWFTQNIDSLEFLTGIAEDKVVTAHGSYRTSTCLECRKKFDVQWLTEHLKNKESLVPRCDSCKGVVKPDITFFGENLPRRFFQCALTDFPKCDLLLIMGTSLVVQPFASLVNEVSEDTPRLLINKQEVGRTNEFERALGLSGLCYGLKDNKRDVFWCGACDDGCKRLAELLDWEHELDHLIQEGEIKYKSKSS